MDTTAMAAAGLLSDDPIKPLTPQQKQQWNDFLDYLEKSGYKGNPALDDRNKQLGQNLMAQYQKVNPDFGLTYDNVKQVQDELIGYRNNLVNSWKAGKANIPDVKSEDQIMAGLSKSDGWLGSKTSSVKFPVAKFVRSDKTTLNYGTDIAKYDAAVAGMRKN